MGYKKSVFRSLALVSQLGITMISPIFLCIFIGYKIDKIADTSYGVLIGIIIGVLAGCNMVYKLVKATLDKDVEEDILEKQNIIKNAKKTKVHKAKIASRVFREKDNE